MLISASVYHLRMMRRSLLRTVGYARCRCLLRRRALCHLIESPARLRTLQQQCGLATQPPPLTFWDARVQEYLSFLRCWSEGRQQQEEEGGRVRRVRQLLDLADDLQATRDDLRQLRQLADQEEELQQLAASETAQLEAALNSYEQQFFQQLCDVGEKDEEDDGDAVLEVCSGAGGQEAMLFARELLQMYVRYCTALKDWTVITLHDDQSDLSGIRKASIQVSGGGVYGRLRLEAGVHRVQRVPRTERHGRLHTSTAAVFVLPVGRAASLARQIPLPPAHLHVATMRAGGAGGQHVNTTDSAVRVTHLPTGMVVQCQQERSQQKNRALALDILRAKLHAQQCRVEHEQRSSTRQNQVSSLERSDKIRTYNYQQDRVTDHRCGLTVHGVQAVLTATKLETIMDAAQALDRHRRTLHILQHHVLPR